MKYRDEIESLGDIGNCICALLTSKSYGVKNGLWEMFERVLSPDIFEGLQEVVKYWEEEQSETDDEIRIQIPKAEKDDWLISKAEKDDWL